MCRIGAQAKVDEGQIGRQSIDTEKKHSIVYSILYIVYIYIYIYCIYCLNDIAMKLSSYAIV